MSNEVILDSPNSISSWIDGVVEVDSTDDEFDNGFDTGDNSSDKEQLKRNVPQKKPGRSGSNFAVGATKLSKNDPRALLLSTRPYFVHGAGIDSANGKYTFDPDSEVDFMNTSKFKRRWYQEKISIIDDSNSGGNIYELFELLRIGRCKWVFRVHTNNCATSKLTELKNFKVENFDCHVDLYMCDNPSPLPPHVGWTSLSPQYEPAPIFVQESGYDLVISHIQKCSEDPQQISTLRRRTSIETQNEVKSSVKDTNSDTQSFVATSQIVSSEYTTYEPNKTSNNGTSISSKNSSPVGVFDGYTTYETNISQSDVFTESTSESTLVHAKKDTYITYEPSGYSSTVTTSTNERDTIHYKHELSQKQSKPEDDLKRVNFNAQFQSALEMPSETRQQKLKKFQRLTEITQNFIFLARTYAKVIILEQFLAPDSRTIMRNTKSIGGIAGGEKFIVGDIFFKAANVSTVYNGSYEFGAKALANDLLGCEHAFNAEIDGLHFALQVVIDYLGHRLQAQALLPIKSTNQDPQKGVNNSTLELGSSNGLWTIASPSGLAETTAQPIEKMRKLGEALNLAPHTVIERSTGNSHLVSTAADLEVHVSHADRRTYLVDLARLFPPESPQAVPHLRFSPMLAGMKGASLFCRLLRPELVAAGAKPLSCDTFTAFSTGDEKGDIYCSDVHDATMRLIQDVIPRLARKLSSSSGALDPMCVGETLHKHGINLRHLGLLRAHVPLECGQLRRVLLVEMVVRALKQFMRKSQRILIRYEKKVSMQRCREFCATAYNTIFGDGPHSISFWCNVVEREVLLRFGWLAFDVDEIGKLRDLCLERYQREILFERLQSSTGVFIESSARYLLQTEYADKRVSKCIEADIKLKPVVRFQYIHDFWKGMLLELSAETKQSCCDYTSSLRLREVAMPHFKAALDSVPNDLYIMDTYIKSLSRLVQLMIFVNPVTLERSTNEGVKLHGLIPSPVCLRRLTGLLTGREGIDSNIIFILQQALKSGQYHIASDILVFLRLSTPKNHIVLTLDSPINEASDTKSTSIEESGKFELPKSLSHTVSSTGFILPAISPGISTRTRSLSLSFSLSDLFPIESTCVQAVSLFCEGYVCGRGNDIILKLKELQSLNQCNNIRSAATSNSTTQEKTESWRPESLKVLEESNSSITLKIGDFSDVLSHRTNRLSSIACQFCVRRLISSYFRKSSIRNNITLNLGGADIGSLKNTSDVFTQLRLNRNSSGSIARSSSQLSYSLSYSDDDDSMNFLKSGGSPGIGAFLTETLPSIKSLEGLILDKNDLEDAGVIELCSLPKNIQIRFTSLKHLSLWNNSFGNRGATSLCKILKNMNSLTHLDVSYNNIEDKSMTQIFVASMRSRMEKYPGMLPLRIIFENNKLKRLSTLEPEINLTEDKLHSLLQKINLSPSPSKSRSNVPYRRGRVSVREVQEETSKNERGACRLVMRRAIELAAESDEHDYKTLKALLSLDFGKDIVEACKPKLRQLFQMSADGIDTSLYRENCILSVFQTTDTSDQQRTGLVDEETTSTLALENATVLQTVSPTTGRCKIQWAGTKHNSVQSNVVSRNTPLRSEVIVIGSANFEHIVLTDKIPRVNSTQIGHGYRNCVGGNGANQAIMAAKLGASVKLLCKLGHDEHADQIIEKLKNNNVDCTLVLQNKDLTTGLSFIIVDRTGHHSTVLNPGANKSLSVADIDRAKYAFTTANVLTISLGVTLAVVRASVKLAIRERLMSVLHLSPILSDTSFDEDLLALPNVVVITKGDMDNLLGIANIPALPFGVSQDSKYLGLTALVEKYDFKVLILIEHGRATLAFSDEREVETVVVPKTKRFVDFSGAAECFVGSFAFFLSQKETISDAAKHAAELCSSVQW